MCPACRVAGRVLCHFPFSHATVIASTQQCIPHRGGRDNVHQRWNTSYGPKPLGSPTATAATEESPSVKRVKHISDAQTEARLAAAALKKGKWNAVSLHEQYRKSGYRTTQQTLRSLLSESFDASLLKFYEKALHLKADATVWAKLVRNASIKANPAATLAIYKIALESGVLPTSALLHPVLRVLCSGGLRPPTEASIDRAIELYQQFTNAHWNVDPANGVASDTLQDTHSVDDPTTPDIAIYNTILRALASSSNVKKYFPIALSLFEDLHSRGIATDAMTSTSIIVLLMRTSPTYEEAFKVYRSFTQSNKGKRSLDKEGYTVVLNTFCNRVGAGAMQIPPAHLFFQIIKDMRTAGHPITAKAYTIILQRLAFLATSINTRTFSRSRQEERAELAMQIRRVHEALRLDSLTPDTALWNQLMDTYQRAQCFPDALSLWEMLYHSSQHDNVSVSVILDACSYANAYGIATKIWDDLTAAHFPLNLRNWKTWLECLCRMGQLEEALKALCLEMGSSNGHHVVKPDTECAHIILSFASRMNEEDVVRERIQRYLPEIWRKL